MIQCLMLDVDGVVVNGRSEDGGSWATDIERDLGVNPEALQSVFFAPHWTNILLGRKELLDVLEVCLPELSPDLTPRAFIDYWFHRDSRVDDAVLADCDELRRSGTRIFLATNQEHMRADFLMSRLGLAGHVDGMIYSAQIEAQKPERAFYEAAARRSGFAPEDIFFVDDTRANVEAAIAAGWDAVQWQAGSSLSHLLEGVTEIQSPAGD